MKNLKNKANKIKEILNKPVFWKIKIYFSQSKYQNTKTKVEIRIRNLNYFLQKNKRANEQLLQKSNTHMMNLFKIP